jgi:hypothetical protein
MLVDMAKDSPFSEFRELQSSQTHPKHSKDSFKSEYVPVLGEKQQFD